MKPARSLLISLLILAAVAALSGTAEAVVTVEASVGRNQIAMDDQLPLFITVTGSADVSDPQPPALPSFEIYSTGRSQNMSIINGQTSSSIQFTYILVPKSPGHFTIPAIPVKIGGQSVSTHPIEIDVEGRGGQTPGSSNAPSVAAIDTHEPTQGLMLRAKVDKKHPTVQEQVTLTIQFLRRVRFLNRPNYTPPDTTGWMSYDLNPGEYTTTINGLGYSVTEVKVALFPTSSGSLTIGPAALECNVENLDADPFDAVFQGFFQSGQTKVLHTHPLTVDVAPLPEAGRPSSFSGSVGHYHLKGELDKTSVKAGEPVTLTLEVEGEGNIKTIGEPVLTLPAAFRRYETVTSLNIHNHGDKIAGSKAFKTVIVPEQPGDYSIAPAKFSYYDPDAQHYVTLASSGFSLKVAPGAAIPAALPAGAVPSPQGGEIRLFQKDIHYLKPTLSPSDSEDNAAGVGAVIALNTLPLLLLGGATGLRLKKNNDLRDPDKARSRRALAQARNRLKSAKDLGGISIALSVYIADKLALAGSGLSLEDATRRLRSCGVPEESLKSLRDLWQEIDRGRFTPAGSSIEENKKIQSQVTTLISRLEKQLS